MKTRREQPIAKEAPSRLEIAENIERKGLFFVILYILFGVPYFTIYFLYYEAVERIGNIRLKKYWS